MKNCKILGPNSDGLSRERDRHLFLPLQSPARVSDALPDGSLADSQARYSGRGGDKGRIYEIVRFKLSNNYIKSQNANIAKGYMKFPFSKRYPSVQSDVQTSARFPEEDGQRQGQRGRVQSQANQHESGGKEVVIRKQNSSIAAK